MTHITPPSCSFPRYGCDDPSHRIGGVRVLWVGYDQWMCILYDGHGNFAGQMAGKTKAEAVWRAVNWQYALYEDEQEKRKRRPQFFDIGTVYSSAMPSVK